MMKLNKLGYTLGEIVMTTAVIGTLTAIAVPNFMRIKMNVNMEMVKQQLRILGQEMNEFYNKANPHHPDSLPPQGNSEEELAITASLNAINRMGYDIEHFVPEDRSTFLDIARPKPGQEGISGDNCYALDPMGLHDRDCWDASGLNLSPVADIFSFPLNYLLSDPNISESEKIKILSGLLIHLGLGIGVYEMHGFPPSGLGAFAILTNSATYESFNQLIEKVYNELQQNGIQLYSYYGESKLGVTPSLIFTIQFDQTPDYTKNYDADYLNSYNSDTKAYMDYLSSYKSPSGKPAPGFGQGETHTIG